MTREELDRLRKNTYLRRAAWAFHAGYDTEGWLQLIRAEALITERQASAAQQRQRKLSSIIWRLEGAIRQIKLLRSETTVLGEIITYHNCTTSIACLERVAIQVRKAMKQPKEEQS